MARIIRLFDFENGTRADAEQVDAEFNNIVEAHNELDDEVNRKVNIDGDFQGTWNGHSFKEADGTLGARMDGVETKVSDLEKKHSDDVTTLTTSLKALSDKTENIDGILRNTQKDVANLNLWQEASKKVTNGHTFGTDFNGNFYNFTFQKAATTLTSPLSKGGTLVNVASTSGFAKDKEIFIFDETNYDRVKIISLSGNSMVIEAVEHDYKTGAIAARNMIGEDGYPIDTKKLEEGFEGSLTWSVTHGSGSSSAKTMIDTAWKTEGSRSYKLYNGGSTGSIVDTKLTKSFDLTNVNTITFDYNIAGDTRIDDAEEVIENPGALDDVTKYHAYIRIGNQLAHIIPSSNGSGSGTITVNVKKITGTQSVSFVCRGARSYSSVDGYKAHQNTINVDNIRFGYTRTLCEFFVELPQTDDVVLWLEGESGASFTGTLGDKDMTAKTENNQTQLYASQELGPATVRVKMVGRKVNKLLGGFA
jgi:hypothetical protein